MKLFNFGKRKEALLKWQNVVMTDSPNKLIMTEKQLRQVSEQQAGNDVRVVNDCVKILGTTVNPDTFFSRLDLLKKTSVHLVKLEPYIKYSGALPSAALNEVEEKEQEAIYIFIDRYYANVHEKAEKFKTDASKHKRYQEFYDSLIPYFDRMNEHNRNYITYKIRDKIQIK